MDLEIKDVEACVPETRKVLFRVPAMDIPMGSRLCLHGASGTGKTTFLHLLAGLLPPDKGQIRLGGEGFSSLSEKMRARKRRRHFGIIFQQFNLLGYLTPFENVMLGIPTETSHREDLAHNALDRMEIDPGNDVRCMWMSQGERQRVAVARVLAARPAIILADEPTSSLDERNASVVVEALFEASEGATLVVVSHDGRIRLRFPGQIDFERLADG